MSIVMLLQSLQLLAADYEQQIQSFPEYVNAPDEIALTFDDTYQFVDSLRDDRVITPAQASKLLQVNQLLEKMSQDEQMWTYEALKSSPRWEEVRELAESVLKAFDTPKQTPNLFWLQYVPDKKQSQ